MPEHQRGWVVLYEKETGKLCAECGEDMHLVDDYGMNGDAFECAACGFFDEVIDLREKTLTPTAA